MWYFRNHDKMMQCDTYWYRKQCIVPVLFLTLRYHGYVLTSKFDYIIWYKQVHYINIKIYRISNQICKAQELKQTLYRNLQWEMLTSCLHSEVLLGLLAQFFNVLIRGTFMYLTMQIAVDLSFLAIITDSLEPDM